MDSANGHPPAVVAAASSPMPDAHNQQALGVLLNSKVKQARVLLIGAGGIGCELLKNLVLAGFGDIEIVDLDTIDLSNLNRQFLFRHEHIKKSKALVAKTVAQRFNANSTVTAHHANIMESRFSVLWFARFAMVFNALDNLEARRHVNRMCLAADVPLIESGTAGFDGQVRVIKKNVTACYDCTDKPVTKSFPVCTIRSTPSQPIHCIVWAKSWLLGEIFGVSEDESAFDNSVAEDNASEIEELKRESTELRRIRENVGSDEFARMLFDKVFDADIQRLRSIEDMWKTRRPPEPLQFDTVMAQTAGDFDCTAEIVRAGQKVWTLEENMVVFMDSLERLRKRMLDMKAQANGGPEPIISFDKDDQDTLDFVAASANIRSVIFGIENKSRFDIKQMAGNIIPAIATTNAIVAGLCVLEAFKVLKGDYMSTKEVFLNPQAKSNRLLCSSRPLRPRVDCPVCSTYNTAMAADLSRATLNDVVQHFLRLELGYGEKDIVVNNDAGLLYDVDETDNLSKRLTDLGVSAGSMLTVIDEDEDDPFVNVVITIDEWTTAEQSAKPVRFAGQPQRDIPRQPKLPTTTAAATIDHAPKEEPSEPTLKRPRSEDVEEQESKRARTAKEATKEDSDHDVVAVEDPGPGSAILVID